MPPPKQSMVEHQQGGGCQPRYASCTTTHEQGRLKPHTDLQREWLDKAIRIAFRERQQQPDMNFARDQLTLDRAFVGSRICFRPPKGGREFF